MLKDDRIKQIQNILNINGVVETNALSKLFDVTEITVRRDLDELAMKGLVTRIHGGAVLPETNAVMEAPYQKRLDQNIGQKAAIALKASALIMDNTKIIIDSGTTTYFLTEKINYSLRLNVVTNAINIATELTRHINVSVLLIGGELRKNTYSCVGPIAEELLKRVRVKQSFIGATGMGLDGELYSISTFEAGVKNAMLNSAEEKIVLIDSSKIGKDEFISFGNAIDCKYIVTDSLISPELVKHYSELGVNLLIAPV